MYGIHDGRQGGVEERRVAEYATARWPIPARARPSATPTAEPIANLASIRSATGVRQPGSAIRTGFCPSRAATSRSVSTITPKRQPAQWFCAAGARPPRPVPGSSAWHEARREPLECLLNLPAEQLPLAMDVARLFAENTHATARIVSGRFDLRLEVGLVFLDTSTSRQRARNRDTTAHGKG